MGWTGRRDRRKKSGDFRTEPRPSPASLVVGLVSAVLLATAAATAIFGGGFDDATPHGQLLGTLQGVAQAQEAHYRQNGEFAARRHSLDAEVPDDVRLTIIRGDGQAWEALVEAPEVGLSCSQSGSWSNGAPVREAPVCYREAG